MVSPDPKPPKRVRDLGLLTDLHVSWRGDCVLDGVIGHCNRQRYSLHHVHKHPRDDLEVNLVMLCGDGTTGHHGRVEAHDIDVCRALARYILTERLDTVAYLGKKLGSVNAAREWLNSQLYAGL